MTSLWHLTQKQERLKREIAKNLDILIGSISTKGPARTGFNLTTKVNQKTVSRHIRKSLLGRVRRMTRQHRKLKALIQELSDTNWEVIKHESE
jgi:hypothetical protein